ncbi:hypothetical protein [Allomuricauda sp. SCSIO 64092]|nr:hypothetical protein [Muricauda sp. SCSIO 64092]
MKKKITLSALLGFALFFGACKENQSNQGKESAGPIGNKKLTIS